MDRGGVKKCKVCKELNKAMDIMGKFDWANVEKAISFDYGAQEILLNEAQVMRIIQMVNPSQRPRKIRLSGGE